jgi:hypothetical protein
MFMTCPAKAPKHEGAPRSCVSCQNAFSKFRTRRSAVSPLGCPLTRPSADLSPVGASWGKGGTRGDTAFAKSYQSDDKVFAGLTRVTTGGWSNGYATSATAMMGTPVAASLRRVPSMSG